MRDWKKAVIITSVVWILIFSIVLFVQSKNNKEYVNTLDSIIQKSEKIAECWKDVSAKYSAFISACPILSSQNRYDLEWEIVRKEVENMKCGSP